MYSSRSFIANPQDSLRHLASGVRSGALPASSRDGFTPARDAQRRYARSGAHRIPVSRQAADVRVHLPLPVWPIVAAVGTPVVQMMGDASGAQHLREPVGRAAVLVGPAPGGQVDVALLEVGEVVRVAEAGHVVDGVVEVEVVVVVPV